MCPIPDSNNNIASILQNGRYYTHDKTCENCFAKITEDGLVTHSVIESYDNLPEFLIIILKRFGATKVNNEMVYFKRQECVVPTKEISINSTSLILKSVLEHSGSQIINGHYHTLIRVP